MIKRLGSWFVLGFAASRALRLALLAGPQLTTSARLSLA